MLADPGESDLSAHVDFPALADAARRGGARPSGPLGQGAFLFDLGITARAEALTRNRLASSPVAVALDRLVAPDKMGTLFKALAITPVAAPKPPGF